jgi:DNA polymerase-3 subunit delta'
MFDDFDTDEDDDAPKPRRGKAAAAEEIPETDGLPPPRENPALLGHEKTERDLHAMIGEGRLPHAIVFTGPQGIGKSTLAFRLARYLLGQGEAAAPEPAGLFGETLPAAAPEPGGEGLYTSPESPAFRQVASGGHPDLMTVERRMDERKGALRASVDVEEVRRILPFMRLTAGKQGGWRIVIVDDADTMTRSAQNAILKILEEPPEKGLLLLVAHRPGNLIATIRSRARFIALKAPPESVFTDMLRRENPGISDTEVETLRVITGGSIGGGLRLQAEGGLSALDTVFDLLQGWPEWNWPQVHHLADTLGRPGQDSAYAAFRQVLLWIVSSLVSAKARGLLPAGPLATETVARLYRHYSLGQLAALHDRLGAHFDLAEHASLDRRQTVLGAFAAFDGREAA